MKLFRNIYVSPVFFKILAVNVIIFITGYFAPLYFVIGQALFFTLTGILLIDIALLFVKTKNIKAERIIPATCSLAEILEVKLKITNEETARFWITVIDETPVQTQIRNQKLKLISESGEKETITYVFTPSERGIYHFGNIHLFIHSILRLAILKKTIQAECDLAVYPSVELLKKYELKVFSKVSLSQGIKKVRRLGHSNEFEQVRTYVKGDDYRKINWKATSRKNELMINQYEDEKAQQVYCIIDKSRAMQSVFNELTLLDHSINSTLAFSGIALRKYDRVGLITFSDKTGTLLPAERKKSQLEKIQKHLYNQKTIFAESDYELLYSTVKKSIKGRSLILLFTNFETNYALERRMDILRKINRNHLLLVVFFEDSELMYNENNTAKNTRDIYLNTIIGKLAIEKKSMLLEFRKYGIQCILTTPEKMTADTINKYLEIKSRGLL